MKYKKYNVESSWSNGKNIQDTWFVLLCIFPDFPGQNESFFITNLFTKNTNVGFQLLAITAETRAVEEI